MKRLAWPAHNQNDKTHLGYSSAWQAGPLHHRSMLRLSVPNLQHGRVQQILAQPRHHWSGKVQGGKMDRAEFPLSVSAMSWSAPGKNTVDDRNYVATHQPRDPNNDWQLPQVHIFPACVYFRIFLTTSHRFGPLPPPPPAHSHWSPITLRQLPTLFPHNFLPGALSTVYLFLRSDFLTTPLTSLFGYKMFYFTPA